MKILSWNVNCDRRVEQNGFALEKFPNWTFEKRWSRIKTVIEKTQPAVFCLQEITRENLDLVRTAFESTFHIFVRHYNETSLAFSFVTALSRSHFPNIEIKDETFYFSETPDFPTPAHLSEEEKRRQNWGEMFERCAFVVKVSRPPSTKDDFLFSEEYDETLFPPFGDTFIVNVHLGLSLEARLKSCQALASFAQKHDRVIILGDFNSFPTQGGPDQIDMMEKGGLTRVSAYADISDDIESTTTFIAPTTFCFYPYDLGLLDPGLCREIMTQWKDLSLEQLKEKTATRHFGGVLDHAFCKGLSCAQPRVLFQSGLAENPFHVNNLFKPFVSYALNMEKKGCPVFPSDHFPLSLEIDFS
jgi:endonuclease/exonuclease/phosphatase family metal-dependent hydrolase